MTSEQKDLLHYVNKIHQLEQLLSAEREKNKKLLKLLAEMKFAAMPWLEKLKRIV